MLAGVLVRLKALFFRRASDAELDEEMRYHLEREAERNVARGMEPAAASDAARRSFGNVTVAAEAARDASRWRVLEELRQDVRYAFRTFVRAPLFVLTVVGTIGLGLGMLTAAFTLFEAYVLRPLAVRDPASLYELAWHPRSGKTHRVTWDDYRALAERRDVLSESYAYMNLFARIRGQPVVGQLVTGNYFAMLGASAAIGRTLLPEDSDAPGTNPVVVLSLDTWRSTFGSDSTIVGKSIALNGVSMRVVGVARDGFGGLSPLPFQFWAPITMVTSLDPERNIFGPKASDVGRMIFRVRPGVSEAQAGAAFLATLRARTSNLPPDKQAHDVYIESRATSIPLTREAIEAFTPLAIAFILVMLIACANVANVMLARGMARQREIGIRLSLGAGRRRLIRQLITESVVLSLPAAAVGYAISRATIGFGLIMMVRWAPPSYRPYLRPIPITADAAIVAFMLLVAVLAAVVFGLAPAIQATRPSVVHATRGDFDSNLRPSRMRGTLVVAQVAGSALLLICAAILLSAARETRRHDAGVRAHNIVQLGVIDNARQVVLDELHAMPDVRRVASAASAPLDGIFPNVRVQIADSAAGLPIKYNFVSPEYFAAVDVALRRGRLFNDNEARGRANVVVVSEATARRLWPGHDPINQHLILQDQDGPLHRVRDATVIGVVANASPGWIALPAEIPTVYYPQPLDAATTMLIVQTGSESETARMAIEQRLEKRDSSAVRDAHSIESSIALQLYPFDMAYLTAGIVGAIALLLTLTGVYGVLAYLVVQRRREFGVRLALGATPGELVVMMLRHLMRLAGMGLAIGVGLALLVARLFAWATYAVNAFDVTGFALGVGVVSVSCLLAAYVPARGIGRVHPSEALRVD